MKKNKKVKKFFYIFLGYIATAIISGCVTNPTKGYISALSNGTALDTKTLYQEQLKDKGLNQELYLMEKGRIAQLEGDYSESKKSFNEQIANLKAREIKDDTLPGAQINIGSVLLNDNALPYKARLFETEMLYIYQTFNYLAEGSLEDALVEVRIIDYLTNQADKARADEKFSSPDFRNNESAIETQLFKNEETIKKKSNAKEININNSEKEKQSSYEEIKQTENDSKNNTLKYQDKIQDFSDKSFENFGEALATSKSSVLNPYAFYLSGLIHEMGNEPDDAYISYKNALLLMPDNFYIQRNVIRLALKLKKDYDFNWLKSKYPEQWKSVSSDNEAKDKARLIILYEDGWIPKKIEKSFSAIAVKIAYPVYDFKWTKPVPLIISEGNKELGITDTVCYLNAQAVRALKEESKWRIIRQSARAALKGSAFASGAVMAANNNDTVKAIGWGIMTASTIYNNASEKADIRSWMSLPNDAQIFDSYIAPGEYEFSFTPKNSLIAQKERITLNKGETKILWIINTGSRLIFHDLWPPNIDIKDKKNQNILNTVEFSKILRCF